MDLPGSAQDDERHEEETRMNKTPKIFALVCGCLVVVGLALAATAWQMGIKPYNIGFNSQGVVVTDDNTPISGKEELSTFTELNCDFDQAQVTLIPSDHYALEYQVFSQDDVPTFSLQGNTLTLTQKSNDVLHANLNLNFASTWNKPYIICIMTRTILYPRRTFT
jgi:hypothetical protein